MSKVQDYQDQVEQIAVPAVRENDANFSALMAGNMVNEGIGSVGRALQNQVAQGFGDVGGVMVALQMQEDALAAKNALVAAQQDWGNYFNNEIVPRTGIAAANVHKDGMEKLNNIATARMNDLSPKQQFLFQQQWKQQELICSDNLGKHQVTETKKANIAVSEALRETNTDFAIADPVHADNFIKIADASLLSSCRQQGLPQEVYQVRRAEMVSKIRAGTLEQMLAQKDTGGAQAYFKQHQGDLLPEHKEAALKALGYSVTRNKVAAAAQGLFDASRSSIDPYGGNIAEQRQKALDQVEKQFSGDQDIETIREAVKGRFSDYESVCHERWRNTVKDGAQKIITAQSDTDALEIASAYNDPSIAEQMQKALQTRFTRSEQRRQGFLRSSEGQAQQHQALNSLKQGMLDGQINIGGHAFPLGTPDDVASASALLGLDGDFQKKAQGFWDSKDSRVKPAEVNRMLEALGFQSTKDKKAIDRVPGLVEQLQMMLPANKVADDQWLRQNVTRLLLVPGSYETSFFGFDRLMPDVHNDIGAIMKDKSSSRKLLYFNESDMRQRYSRFRMDSLKAGRLQGWMNSNPGSYELNRFAEMTGLTADGSGNWRPVNYQEVE